MVNRLSNTLTKALANSPILQYLPAVLVLNRAVANSSLEFQILANKAIKACEIAAFHPVGFFFIGSLNAPIRLTIKSDFKKKLQKTMSCANEKLKLLSEQVTTLPKQK